MTLLQSGCRHNHAHCDACYVLALSIVVDIPRNHQIKHDALRDKCNDTNSGPSWGKRISSDSNVPPWDITIHLPCHRSGFAAALNVRSIPREICAHKPARWIAGAFLYCLGPQGQGAQPKSGLLTVSHRILLGAQEPRYLFSSRFSFRACRACYLCSGDPWGRCLFFPYFPKDLKSYFKSYFCYT